MSNLVQRLVARATDAIQAAVTPSAGLRRAADYVAHSQTNQAVAQYGEELTLGGARSHAGTRAAAIERAAHRADASSHDPTTRNGDGDAGWFHAFFTFEQRHFSGGSEGIVRDIQRTEVAGCRPFNLATAALREGDLVFGAPHGHMHPPNLIFPATVPINLPSVGQLRRIPILSCSSTTRINGRAAARCGDYGVGVFCGGYLPLFEVFTGSSSVWIEGSRAARRLDVTRHCVFDVPGPMDPPLGMMVGVPLTGSLSVHIGGLPMPSLTSLAIGGAFNVAFRIGGRLLRGRTAADYVKALLARGRLAIDGPQAFVDDVVRVLEHLAKLRTCREGIELLEQEAARRGERVVIRAQRAGEGANCDIRDPNRWDMALWDYANQRPGQGIGSVIAFSPERYAGGTGAMQPHFVLYHELMHALNNARGRSHHATRNLDPATAATHPFWNPEGYSANPWHYWVHNNREERIAVELTNRALREEAWHAVPRPNYW